MLPCCLLLIRWKFFINEPDKIHHRSRVTRDSTIWDKQACIHDALWRQHYITTSKEYLTNSHILSIYFELAFLQLHLVKISCKLIIISVDYERIKKGARFFETQCKLQGGPKMAPHFVRLIALSNINRFFKFFHCQNQETICNQTVTIDPTTPKMCRYTTLWNVSFLKITIKNKTTFVTTHFKKLTTETENCLKNHISHFSHQIFNVSALLLYDASKPATPLTNSAINQRLWHFAVCTTQRQWLSLAGWLLWIVNIDRPSVDGHPKQHNWLKWLSLCCLGATCQARSTLITQLVSGVAGLSASSDISRNSVATHLRCGWIYSDSFISNCLLILTVTEFWKLVNIWWSYEAYNKWCHFWPTLYFLTKTPTLVVYRTYGVFQKRYKVYGTIILQPYITESCGSQQNVQKEILYMTNVIVWKQQLNILCFEAGELTIQKQY